MMKNIKHYIANANGTLSKFEIQIEKAVKMAEDYAVMKLKIKFAINIIFINALDDVIPETHIGGRTYSNEFITIAIDSSVNEIKTEDLFQMICHELCHAARWQYNNELMSTLLDGMIFEGLATAFEIEAALENKLTLDYFAKTVANQTDNDNEKILDNLRNELNSQNYDYHKIFYPGDERLDLPRWAGYSVGYYLVKKYMAKTNKNASEIFAEKYSVLEKLALQ